MQEAVMAATATGTDRTVHAGLGGGPRPRNGNGFHQNGGGDEVPLRFSPARYRIGIWMAIGSILMLFVALTSSYIVRSASSDDWRRIPMPKILWLSTALLVVSSITIELSRRSLKSGNESGYSLWLINTGVLGVAFVASQLFAWRQLVRQGAYLASNPYNSFFYLFTGAHGVHVMGGLCALGYLVIRTRGARKSVEGELRRTGAADAVAIYWHFMDVLWIGLFMLLTFWK
jgi:cytochrome c oxidase subunit 3